MSGSNTHPERESAVGAASNAGTFDERWTLWQAEGARHDTRVGRKVRLIAAVALTLGGIWASVSLL